MSNSAIAIPARKNRLRILKFKWACIRMLIQGYAIFALFSMIGGLLSYPVFTIIFLDDYRFWKYFHLIPRLFVFVFRSVFLIFRSGADGFLFSVPLTAAPATGPDLDRVMLVPTWPYGLSCGKCTQCCNVIHCPLLDYKTDRCMGYNSLYWRYFNCGRFPVTKRQLDFYRCTKWQMR
jgi:hypothetical protein